MLSKIKPTPYIYLASLLYFIPEAVKSLQNYKFYHFNFLSFYSEFPPFPSISYKSDHKKSCSTNIIDTDRTALEFVYS